MKTHRPSTGFQTRFRSVAALYERRSLRGEKRTVIDRRYSITIAFVGLFALAQSASAALKWEQTQIELHPKPGEAVAVGSFKYKNEGKDTVHIKSVHTSCGCTTAARKKDDVAPGESGEITATFKIGSSTGTATKTVQVETDDPSAPMTVLTLRAVIPQMVEIQPTFVYWENSEEPKAKTIKVKMAKELQVQKLNVTSSSPAFETKVTSNGANEFRIEVKPHDTSQAVNATLTVQPDNGSKPSYVMARVVDRVKSSQ
jgi:hypothetical protein